MLGKEWLTRFVVSAVSVGIIITSSSGTELRVQAENETVDTETSAQAEDFISFRKDSYDRYISQYETAPRPNARIRIEGEAFSGAQGMKPSVVDNDAFSSTGTSVVTDEVGSIDWEIDVTDEGLYNIGIKYFPIEGKSSSIEREFLIDGEIPFDGARTLAFPRVWANEKDEIERDNRGNDLYPRQKEAPLWQESVFRDTEGYQLEPYSFYFTKGKHTITLVSSREPMLIDYLTLYQEETIPEYNDVLKRYEEFGYKKTETVTIKLQGEAAHYKSSPTLYPITDRASPATEPYHVSNIRINTIGGNNWRVPGQWIAWDMEVPEDGLYKIALKNRQNLLRGLNSTRRLTIDGKVPFREMETILFQYDPNWNMNVLGGEEEPYLFYLTKGKHELKLEVSLGEIAPLLRQVESSILELNYIYRKILIITGALPDPFRDYQLDKQIPDLLEVLNRQSDNLFIIAQRMEEVSGETSDKTAILNTLANQLKDFAERPDSIPQRLDQFKTNVGGLGTWILTVREQPLELDYLIISSPDAVLPKAEASAFRKVIHELSAFFTSFFMDYNTIGNVNESEEGKSVTVWIGTGRDQAQVLKAMIDDTFTPRTGIQVNLKLVQPTILLPATLAGQGPDVAMQFGNEVPVNYAVRNAVQDLTKFPDYPEVASRFRESAIVPYRYQSGVFALPEQQIFPMLFYRKDIFEELGLEVPQMWEDVYQLIPELQKRHLEFGLPIDQSLAPLVPNQGFAMLLYQAGGAFYKDDGVASDLDSKQAMLAFQSWTELYTNYKFPLAFDFANRFRTGEMPAGIIDYTAYNQLQVFAPEIRGLWEFTPVPGTVTADGTIRRDVAGSGTSVIMLKSAKDKQASWEFMKWWTSDEVQVRFGREMEGLMGAAARYPTANQEALKQLPWPIKDYQNLEKQWEWVRGIPEVPGGYFTGRHVDNAFREVINNGTDPREALYDYTRVINDEIELKREEFHLSD